MEPLSSEVARLQHELVERNLTHHRPVDDDVIDIMSDLRTEAKSLGHRIVDLCPHSREKSIALTKLEEVVMWSIASLARPEQ